MASSTETPTPSVPASATVIPTHPSFAGTTYYLRTYHRTFFSVRRDGAMTAVPPFAVGNFERFHVRPATRAEIQTLVDYKARLSKGDSNARPFGWDQIQPIAIAPAAEADDYGCFATRLHQQVVVTHPTATGGSRPNGDSAALYAVNEGGVLHPLIVVRALGSCSYLGLSESGKVVSRGTPHGAAANPAEIFTLRRHPRLRPHNFFYMLHGEAVGSNVAAIPIGPASLVNDSPSPSAEVSNEKAFNAVAAAPEWCGFEFIPTVGADCGLGEPTAPPAAPLLPTAELPRNGSYVVTAHSTNARLAMQARSGGKVELTAVSPTSDACSKDTQQNCLSGVVVDLVQLQGDEEWGAKKAKTTAANSTTADDQHTQPTKGIFSIQSRSLKSFAGLEKTTLKTAAAANAWERWEIAPHPEVPYHHTIRNVAFNKYLCVDPSVRSSNGMVVRVSDKPGVWEAFYFGPNACDDDRLAV